MYARKPDAILVCDALSQIPSVMNTFHMTRPELYDKKSGLF